MYKWINQILKEGLPTRMKNLALLLLFLQTSNVFAESHVEVTPGIQKISIEGTAANTATKIFGSDEYIITANQTLVTHEVISSVVYSCENTDTNADGTKGNWDDFYNLPNDQKSKALDDAILGVGKKVSPYLVSYFSGNKKPRSWIAFSSLIQQASQEISTQYGINSGWASQVIYKYKQQNMQNLGYLSDNSSTCTATVHDYDVDSSEKLPDLTALVKTQVQNISLLPGETENLTISYDGKRVSVSKDTSYNSISANIDYSDFGRRYDTSASLLISGTARNQVTPNSMVESRNSKISTDGTLTISHPSYTDLMRNPEFASQCKAIVSASVIATTGSFWNSKNRTTTTKDFTLDLRAGQTTASLGNLGLGAKEQASVSYTVRFAPGCPFYNTNPSLQSIIE